MCVLSKIASPEALHPPRLSISLPSNIIRALTTTVSARWDLPHMNAYSTAIIHSRHYPNSFCPTHLSYSEVAPLSLCLLSVFLWRSTVYWVLWNQLDSVGCCRCKVVKKPPLNTEKSESPNCFLMCLAAGQLSLLRECECLFMFFLRVSFVFRSIKVCETLCLMFRGILATVYVVHLFLWSKSCEKKSLVYLIGII